VWLPAEAIACAVARQYRLDGRVLVSRGGCDVWEATPALLTTPHVSRLEDKDAVERAVSLGKGLAGPIDADGWIALVADPSGHMVGAYARSDDWHAIKGEA